MERSEQERARREEQWKLFASTGSIYHYLDYKLQQAEPAMQEGTEYADLDRGPCTSASQSGGGGSDPHDPYT